MLTLEQNHKLDWFFNAYVYGTEIPSYTVTSTFEKKGDDTIVHFKLSQTGVSESFTMVVPLYIEYDEKDVRPLGAATMKGPHEIEQTVNLGKLTAMPKRLVANYNFDVLTSN